MRLRILTNLLALVAASLQLSGCATDRSQPSVTAASHGNITNYETRDKLQSFNPIDCVAISGLSRTNTPADIYPAVKKCVDHGNYVSAAALYAVGGVYGNFDQIRVADKSAHDAVRVLQFNFANSLGELQRATFGQAIQREFSDAAAHSDLCTSLKALGPPDYTPTYMVQHGMNAFRGGTKGGELVPDFDATKAWAMALDTAAHCTGGT